MPFHAWKDIHRGLLLKIVKDTRIDPDEFFAAFR